MIIFRSEKGVTLVEVIASITILSIVLISFFNFFPQMGFMNKQNEDKLQGINTAKQVMVKWKESGDVQGFIKNYHNGNPTFTSSEVSYDSGYKLKDGIPVSNDPNVDADTLLYTSTIEDLSIKIEILIESDLKGSFKTEAHQIHVKVLNNKDKLLSESYGYVIAKPVNWE